VAMISNPTNMGHVVGFDPDGSVMVQWHGGKVVTGVSPANLRGLPPGYAGRRMESARTPAPRKHEAEAGFAIGIHDEGVIEDNTRELMSSPEWRGEMVHDGFVTKDGEITRKGWDQLNADIVKVERNSLSWLRRTFNHVRDDGHSSHDELVGSFWFDPTDYNHAWLVELASPSPGRSERIDMVDSSYGDLASYALNGISRFGESVLGGQITFFDVQPEDWETIENTVERGSRSARRRR
jgi:hypothetical protein